MNYRELTRRLRALGCQEIPRRAGGSHRKWLNPAALKEGTIKGILKQLCISRDDFDSV
jgi:predicted RNA binding protein YcfA (HicA-like mRNA interferase family)